MKNSVLILSEQRRSSDETSSGAIIPRTVTAWLPTDVERPAGGNAGGSYIGDRFRILCSFSKDVDIRAV